MEKRSSYERTRGRVKVKEEKTQPVIEVEEEVQPVIETEEPSKTVQLVLLRNKIVNIQGSATQKVYTFKGAGSILDVDERDAPQFLLKGKDASCCSGNPTSPYFQLVE